MLKTFCMWKEVPEKLMWFRNMDVNLSNPLPARLSPSRARCAAVKIPFPPDIFALLLLLSWRMHSYYEEEGGGFLWAPIPPQSHPQKWKPTSQCPKAHVRPPQRRGERLFWGQILTWLFHQIYVSPSFFSLFREFIDHGQMTPKSREGGGDSILATRTGRI